MIRDPDGVVAAAFDRSIVDPITIVMSTRNRDEERSDLDGCATGATIASLILPSLVRKCGCRMDFVRFSDPSMPAVNALAATINGEAEIARVPACALAAIVQNETGGRNIIQNGTDPETMLLPNGSRPGVGCCQITAGVDWSNPAAPTYAGYDLWNVSDNLYVAAVYFLAPVIQDALRLQHKDPVGFALFGDGQILFYAFAGYNAGWGNVMACYNSGRNPDSVTTNEYAARGMVTYLDFVSASHAQGMTAPN